MITYAKAPEKEKCTYGQVSNYFFKKLNRRTQTNEHLIEVVAYVCLPPRALFSSCFRERILFKKPFVMSLLPFFLCKMKMLPARSVLGNKLWRDPSSFDAPTMPFPGGSQPRETWSQPTAAGHRWAG